MGDRGNIVVQEEPGKRVYFYTHWRGSDIVDIVKTALARRQRWTDPAYLGRIIFCTLVPEAAWAGGTGYGISTGVCDNGHDVVVVDCGSQSVWFENDEGVMTNVRPVSFEEFIKA